VAEEPQPEDRHGQPEDRGAERQQGRRDRSERHEQDDEGCHEPEELGPAVVLAVEHGGELIGGVHVDPGARDGVGDRGVDLLGQRPGDVLARHREDDVDRADAAVLRQLPVGPCRRGGARDLGHRDERVDGVLQGRLLLDARERVGRDDDPLRGVRRIGERRARGVDGGLAVGARDGEVVRGGGAEAADQEAEHDGQQQPGADDAARVAGAGTPQPGGRPEDGLGHLGRGHARTLRAAGR